MLGVAARHIATFNVTILLDTHRQIPNRSHKSAAGLFPMKHLTGIERHRQIELWRANFHELHRWIRFLTD